MNLRGHKFLLVIILFYLTSCVLLKNKTHYKDPEFNGGNLQINKYFKKYINYPLIYLEKNIQECISAKLYINKSGIVTNIEAETNSQLFIYEIRRTSCLMPKWKPGKLNNINIDTTLTKIFCFEIGKENTVKDPNSDTIHIIAYKVSYYLHPDQSIMNDTKRLNELYRQNDSLQKIIKRKLEEERIIDKLYETGVELYNNSKYKEALYYFNLAIKNSNSSKNAYFYYRGNTYFKLNNNKKACADWLEAYRSNYSYAADLYDKTCRCKQ